MPLLRSFGFGWRGGYKDVAPTALDAARLIFLGKVKKIMCGELNSIYFPKPVNEEASKLYISPLRNWIKSPFWINSD